MRIEQLEIFVSTSDAKSMHVASNLLHVTQQNISKTIKQLEEELNITLFIRSNTGISLTEEGKIAYVHSKKLLSNANALRQIYPNSIPSLDPSIISGNLEITTSPGFLTIVSNIIRNIDNSVHQLAIFSSEQEASDINQQLFTNQLNYETCFTALELQDLVAHSQNLTEKYNIYLLTVEPLHLVTNAYSPLGLAKSVTLKEIAELPMIFYKSTPKSTPLWLQCLKSHGFRSKNIKETGIPSICADYLISNSAYTVATPFYYQNSTNFSNRPTLTLVPIKKTIPIAHALFVKKKASPPVQYFEQLFKSSYADTYTVYDGNPATIIEH